MICPNCKNTNIAYLKDGYHCKHCGKWFKQYERGQTIAKKTGASTATISRVARCLNHGAEGYTMIVERLKEDE